jgi:hypothetical protein
MRAKRMARKAGALVCLFFALQICLCFLCVSVIYFTCIWFEIFQFTLFVICTFVCHGYVVEMADEWAYS